MLLLVAILLIVVGGTPTVHAQFTFTDINPDSSNLDPSDSDGASGGRVNGLATVPGSNTTFYAASEWGGIYKTTDGGTTWFRLNGHNPNATWDVEVNPDDSSNVFATSFYDGRDGDSLSGINVSTNFGNSWARPATALPPGGGFCSSPEAVTEPSAFGIAVDPESTDDVYIGTNCGLAISNDAGATWTYRNTKPTHLAWWVIDVVVHHGGIIDICGYWGHQRSTNGGLNFTEPSPDLPGGRCSIAASPDEADVLFVTVGANIYESDDGGATWSYLGTPDKKRQGRIPFVATNPRSGDSFDLWYGDIRLYRGECTSNVDGLRCPEGRDDPDAPPPDGWNGPFTRSVGGHDDLGDIVFDVTATENATTEIYSCDGGVYFNEDNTSPGCHDPNWEQPNITPHGLWLWTMSGVDVPGDEVEEHIYMGNQDNGPFGATDGGAGLPLWNNSRCCDGFDTSADDSQVLFTVCCGSPRATKMWHGGPGMSPYSEVNNYPDDGLFPGFRFPDILDTFGPGDYVALTVDCTVPGDDDDDNGCSGANDGEGGVYIATGATVGSISWTEIGDDSEPPTGGDDKTCAVKAALDGGVPTFYVQVGRCSGVSNDELWKFVGTDPNDEWEQVNLPAGGISIFAVDPTNSQRLFAANNRIGDTPAMVISDDGGATWDPLPELDDLMTGGGDFKYRIEINAWGNDGYPQPTLVAFDPEDPNILVAGGWDSGVFLSTDGGEDWTLVTNPDSTSSSPPHLPQPRYAYLDHEPSAGTEISMYIGTRGRGVWRVSFDLPPIADANGPYTTDEGTDVQLDGTGSYDPTPGGSIVSYEWDFDDDGQFDDATGATPFFDPIGDGVGQDGVYTVRLRVTDNDGLTDTDESTVTVNNVPPVVVPASNSPRDENTIITVTATVTDPGWLDVLTATIDWGVGAGSVPMTLTGSENTRPNAVYTFSATFIYGDNGVFTAQVCGSDDDTTTCADIDLTVLNVAPTVAIDETDIVEGCGGDAFIAHAGENVTFTGNATDPGSDDLDLTWSWGDGTADVTTTYLVNPPATDPLPSPSIQPRDVTDIQVHAFDSACLYEVTFSALDDDGGSDADTTDVVIAGNADRIRSAGYWHHNYRGKGRRFFTDEQLQCYLDIVNHMSSVFSEETNASTIDDAEDVLNPAHSNGDIRVQFDRQLIAAWLNFANGAIEHDELVDTDFDDVPDTALLDVLCDAEAARLNPATTDAELENWKDILEGINLMDEGSSSS